MSPHVVRSLSVVALAALAACAPAPAPDPAAAPAPVAVTASTETPASRGEYLVLVGGCDDCHTPGGLHGPPDMTRRLAGSEVPWGGPWGITYGRNLTSDPETGLGNWTEDQVYRALKNGVRPDGSVLLPPMPWPRFAMMKDEDVRAIAAYLKTVPAVAHAVPPSLPPGSPAPAGTVAMSAPPAWDVPPAAATASVASQ